MTNTPYARCRVPATCSVSSGFTSTFRSARIAAGTATSMRTPASMTSSTRTWTRSCDDIALRRGPRRTTPTWPTRPAVTSVFIGGGTPSLVPAASIARGHRRHPRLVAGGRRRRRSRSSAIPRARPRTKSCDAYLEAGINQDQLRRPIARRRATARPRPYPRRRNGSGRSRSDASRRLRERQCRSHLRDPG